MIQIRDQPLQTAVPGVGGQVPVEARLVVPLPPLAELAAHEEQLLSRRRPLIAKEQAQVGTLLPFVAGHLGDQRSLSVHHLVVAQGQDEILVKGVEAAKGEKVVVEAAVHRVALHVVERIVHPAHVPFEAETEAAEPDRP